MKAVQKQISDHLPSYFLPTALFCNADAVELNALIHSWL